jgi:hypothetical protein
MNLLDMNNDVLNIIGDYVKRNNEVEEIFKRVDKWTNYLKKKNRFGKDEMRWLVYYQLHDCSYDEIDEYIKTRDLEQYITF